jgi:hypothetical protein
MLPDNPYGMSYLRHVGMSIVNLLADYFPYFIIVIIGIGFSAAFYLDRLDYAIRGLIIGIPALLAAYSLIKMRVQGKLDGNIILLHVNKYFITGLFITLYLFAISSVILSETRPWYYFILISCLFCIVGVQIFSNNQHPYLILGEIVALIINLAYSVVLKYPLYFGWSDSFYLIGLSKVTLLSGYVIPPDLDISYANFPLYHIYLAEIAALLGLDIQTVLFTVMIIPYAVIILFIFKLFYGISNNQQLSLLSCLIYAGLSVVIFYGTYIQTRVMAYLGFIILLYTFYKGINPGESKMVYRIIFFLTLVYMILVHQVSSFQIIPLLLVLFIIEWVVSEKKVIRLDLLASMVVLTLSYWIFAAAEYFRWVLISRLTIFGSENLMMVKPTVQTGNEWEFVFNNLDTAILVFFILCGIGYLLYSERKNYLVVFALFGLAMLPFFVPNPLQLFLTSMVIFRADRMMLLLAPFFAFLVAWGIVVQFNLFEKLHTSKKVCGSILIMIIFFFSLFSMTLTNASDSKDIFWSTQKNYFNQGEIFGLIYISENIPLNSTLTSDYYVRRYFGVDRWFSKSDEFNFPSFTTAYLNYTGSAIAGRGYLIIREKELRDKGLLFQSNDEVGYILPFNKETQEKMNKMFNSTNRLYDSSYISITEYPH